MTREEEKAFAALAKKMADLSNTEHSWEASRYWTLGALMEQLAEYCPVPTKAKK